MIILKLDQRFPRGFSARITTDTFSGKNTPQKAQKKTMKNRSENIMIIFLLL